MDKSVSPTLFETRAHFDDLVSKYPHNANEIVCNLIVEAFEEAIISNLSLPREFISTTFPLVEGLDSTLVVERLGEYLIDLNIVGVTVWLMCTELTDSFFITIKSSPMYDLD